jgi:hypothetical protein
MPDAIWAVSRLPPDLSRSPGLAPVSTPLEFVTTRHQRFAHARLPDPHLTRSCRAFSRSAHHERHLTDAACGGLGPPPAGRPRRTYLHLLHSTASSGFHINASFSVRDTRPAKIEKPRHMTGPSAAVDSSSGRFRNSRCSCFAPAPGLDKHCGCRIGHPRHATWAYSCISPPSRSRRRTRSWDGNVGGGSGWSGAAWFSVRCGRWSLKCATYSASTRSRWRRLRISIRSSSSRRTVPIHRSAIAFARGARTGVRRTRMASLANTASKTPVNLLSRSGSRT